MGPHLQPNPIGSIPLPGSPTGADAAGPTLDAAGTSSTPAEAGSTVSHPSGPSGGGGGGHASSTASPMAPPAQGVAHDRAPSTGSDMPPPMTEATLRSRANSMLSSASSFAGDLGEIVLRPLRL